MEPKKTEAQHYRCPTCKKAVEREEKSFPFCSERCRTIDLGRWATGDYRIAGEPAPVPDESEVYD